MPSLQEAYALPDSPKHISTITQGMQNVQLTQTPTPSPPTSAWPQFLPQHSRLAQSSPLQSPMTQSPLAQTSATHSSGSRTRSSGILDPAQRLQWGSARVQNKQHPLSKMAQGLLQQRQQTTATAGNMPSHSTDANTMAQNPTQQRHQESASAAQMQWQSSSKQSNNQHKQHPSAHTALQQCSDAAHRQRPEWSNVTSSRRLDWSTESGDWKHPEVQYFREEALAEEAALQEQACSKHLAGYLSSTRKHWHGVMCDVVVRYAYLLDTVKSCPALVMTVVQCRSRLVCCVLQILYLPTCATVIHHLRLTPAQHKVPSLFVRASGSAVLLR